MAKQINWYTDYNFRYFLDIAGVVIMVLNPDQTVSLINKKGCEVLGYAARDIIGKNWFNHFVPETIRAKLRSRYDRFIGGKIKTEEQIEHLVRTKNGEERIIDWKIELLKDESGDVVGSLFSGEGVTTRNRMQAALQEEHEILAQIIEGSPIPTFVIDKDHNIIHWNKACENLTEISARKVLGTNQQWRAFYPEKRPVLADMIVDNAGDEKLGQYYANKYQASFVKRGAYVVEDFFPSLGNGAKWLHATAAPLKDSIGRIVGAIETIQDITERKLAELGLKESEKRYRSLFESANDSILLLKDEFVADCNEKTLVILNCVYSEIIGKSIFDFFPMLQPDGRKSKDVMLNTIISVLKGHPQQFELTCCRFDGQLFDAEVSLTKVNMLERKFLLAIVRDVTSRKVMENDLLKSEKELNEKTQHLAKMNQALKAMLDHREVEKKAIEENMLLNLKKFVLPYLEDMSRCKMTRDAETFLKIIQSNLDNLISSISNTLYAKYQDLTPREIQIADLIRQGKSTKEIADIIYITAGSVSFHRNNIRKKLGLLKRRANLRSYLTSLT